jgi:hypothetical protein
MAILTDPFGVILNLFQDLSPKGLVSGSGKTKNIFKYERYFIENK